MRTLRPIVILAFSSVLIPASMTSGQSSAAQSPAVPAPQSAPATSAAPTAGNAGATVLHEATNLVLVDVVVTNHDKPVHGLEQQSFHVFEDGHEQAIASFDEHRAPEAAVPRMKRAALPSYTYTNIPDYPEAGAVNVLLLDGLNTPLNDQMNVRLKMIQYLGKIKPGTSLAIFGLSSRLRMIAGFSTDLAALTAALKSPKIAARQSTILDMEKTAEEAGATAVGQSEMTTPTEPGLNPPAPVSDAAGDNGPMDIVAAARVFEADIASFQADVRATMTLDAMQQLARYLSAIPGRKNVIWFSGSFPSWTPPDNSLGPGAFRAVSGRMEHVRETTKILSDARISIYPVDARGLTVPFVFSAANNHPPMGNTYTPGTAMTPFATQLHNERDETMREQATMQQIADDTGGKAFLDTNDFGDAVAEVVENGSTYYTLGYVPSRNAFDGQFHNFKVRLDDAGYKLAYRRGYYADPPDQPSAHHPGEISLLLAASGHGAPVATQISFVARVLPASDPLLQGAKLTQGPVGEMTATIKGPAHRFVADLVLNLGGLVFNTLADGSRQASLELALTAYDDEGARVNYLEHAFRMTLTADRFPKLMASGVPIRAELDLPSGQGSLRIAIHDIVGGRAGSLEVPVNVAAQ
jgi:VWFA-related protein